MLGTMFDGRTLHSREVMQRLVEAWGDKVFHTVIRRTVKFSDSTVAGEPITTYAATSAGRRLLPPAGQGGAGAVPRRVNLPSADDLFRPTDGRGASGRRDGRAGRSAPSAPSRTRLPRSRCAKKPSGRIRHDEKVTVYVTSQELFDIEHARLSLRSEHGLAVDRGRLLREAVSLVLADLEENGDKSALVRRLSEG